MFEGVFDERTLKKGFLLFDKNKLSTEKRTGAEYSFEFDHSTLIKFTKRGTKISAFTCSCGATYCEHLCAALFYLERDKWETGGISKLKKKAFKTSSLFDKLCRGLKAELKKRYRRRGDEFDIVKNFQLLHPDLSVNVFNLVLINELSSLLPASGQEQNILTEAMNQILQSKLTNVEQNYWKAVTKNRLPANFRSQQAVFAVLFPKAVIYSDGPEIQELKTRLDKVKLKKVYKHHLHPVQIARYMLQVKESGFKSSISSVEDPAEFSIAATELYLASGKINRAFDQLKKDYEHIRSDKPANFIAYLERVIEMCENRKRAGEELFFISELIVHDTMVHQKHLGRLDQIIPVAQRKKIVDALLSDVKRSQPEFYFDKLVQLLESDNRLDELIREISKRSDKFFLMNRIAIKKLPDYDEFTLNSYTQQFANILYEARETYHQKQLFEKAKVYFEGLPEAVSKKLAAKILEKIGKNNFVYEELRKYAEEN